MTQDSKIKRVKRPAAEILALLKQGQDYEATELADVSAGTVVYADNEPGGGGGAEMSQIKQSCADNATTDIILGSSSLIIAALLIYRGHTDNAGTEYFESGFCVVWHDGTNGEVVGPYRNYTDAGYCLDDDAPIAADLNGGNLRINVTTKNRGAACDFRATFIIVEAQA